MVDVGERPLAVDLYAGLGGWTDGLLAEGYYCVGFDIEQHVYGEHRYPGQLVIQDVRTLHGRQFKDAALIVCSPPCQEFSYMAMPWTRAKQIARALRGEDEFPEGYTGSRTIAELTSLFDACFRIQREACEAAGRHIPMVVENVRGAQPWVGRARWSFGSFYLWGDVPALMPPIAARSVLKAGVTHHSNGTTNFHGHTKNEGGSWFAIGSPGQKMTGRNPDGRKTTGHRNIRDGHSHARHLTNQAEREAVKVAGLDWSKHGELGYKPKGFNVTAAQRFREQTGLKNGGDWFGSGKDCSLQRRYSGTKQPGIGGKRANGKGDAWFQDGAASYGSKSDSRKAASAMIAKIPLPLSTRIARTFRPSG